MATKKTTVIEEEITPAVAPNEPNPTEVHDQAVLEALDPNAAIEIEPEKMDEPVVEEPKVEEEVKTEPVDQEALKKQITDDLVAKLKGTEVDKAEEVDKYEEWAKKLEDKEGRPPTWREAADYIKTVAVDEIKAQLAAEVDEEEKKAEETQAAQEAQQQEVNDTLNKDWDEQLDDLVKKGLIPAVKDPNNNEVTLVKDAEGKVIEQIPVEEGKRARYDLFKAMYLASEDRINNGAKPLTNLKEIYYEHYSKNKQPAGADAPVAGVRKSVTQDSGTSFKYSDVHNANMEDLLKQAQ